MPLLPKYFGKRDKSSNNLEVSDTNPPKSSLSTSSKSSENVLPGRNSLPDTNGSDAGHRTFSPSKKDDYSNTKGSSSSSRLKMTMSSFKRKATVPDKFSTSPRSSLSVRDSLEPPPSRTSVFMAFGRSSSSQSLPNDPSKSPYGVPQLPVIDLPDPSLFRRPSPITSQTTLPVPKTPEMRTSSTVKIFNWGSKPTRMSEAPQLDLQIPSSSNQDPPDSFSLKSFRPVRPASPSPSNALDLQLPPVLSDQPRSQSPASLLPPSPVGDPRPRGSSMSSDTSQKITVAQFRQAQLESAKNRSSVHLPVPEHPSDSMPPGNVPLHMSLARPASPSFALAAGNSAGTSGNESAGESGAPSRPGRLLPPQAIGRSSPIPREKTPISSSPGLRPGSTSRPQDGARLSAKWMLTSDSESEASEDTASDDATRRTSKKPPLIGDFRKLNGTKSPKPDTSTSPYPSSFASPPINRIAKSGSKSDLGHSSSSTARHTAKPSSPTPLATATHIRSSSSFTPSTSSIQNIKPGQYSGGASPPSPSVMTHITGESADTWSATHSAVHSRQGSSDQLFRQGQRGMAKSDLGHGGHIKRSAGVSVRRTGTVDNSLSTPSNRVASRSQSTNISTQPSPSSFSAPKAGRRATAPAMLESDTEEEGQPSSTEDDTPLSTLLPPRRPGSGLSSQGSGSPRTSTITLPIRDQSPTRSTRSTATRLSRSSLGGLGSAPRSMTSPDSRKVSTNSTSPVSKEQVSEPKSPLSRGRKPLIDLSSSSPTVTTQPPRSTAATPPPAISGNEPNQASLLTPPISERGFTSSPEAARKQSPATSPSSFLRPGPSAIQRNHGHLTRPFTRDDSPASSVGNSSIGSGIFPNTPGTGSDAGRSIGNSQSVITTSSGSSGNDAPRIGGGKQPSITFDESVIFTQKKTLHRRGISGSSSGSTGGLNPYDEQEAKRNERRRNEAKASVELGRVVNGPAPVDPDDDEEDNTAVLPITQNQPPNWNPWQNMSQHQQAHAMGVNVGPTAPGMSPLQMNMGMNINMGNPIFNPLMSQVNMGGLMPPQQMYNPMMQAGMGMPMGFNLPPVPTMSNMMMGMDPSMMAAHQQAMAMAKHAYQMAVAQQAIAAAGDEWERSSNMGYGSVPRAPTMYGTPAGSVYSGGSLLGVGAPVGGSIWGGSVYGDAFGPAQHQHDRRQIPAMGGHYGSSLEAEDVNSRAQGRKRTVTSPSSALPPAHLRGAGAPPMPPPSSWRPS